MKKNQYELEWLDGVVSVQLNPEIKGIKPLSNEETNEIKERISLEEREVLSRLKNRLFSIKDESASKTLVKKYHDDLVLMITKNYDHLHNLTAKRSGLKELHEFIGDRLQHILRLFEKELSSFLGSENQVPITQLVTLKKEIEDQHNEIEAKLSTGAHGTAPVDIVMEVFHDFIAKVDHRLPVTSREANYIKDLLKDVLAINGEMTSITGCPVLNELLIIWNLNSKTCIRYFTQGTKFLMNEHEGEEAQLAFLKFELKKLNIIPEKQDFVLDPDYPSVKAHCTKWLLNEIKYRENILEGFVPLQKKPEQSERKEAAFKVLLDLSADQIALLLRAADQAKVIHARSLTTVFDRIIPYLSTPAMENLSPANARKKSYAAEQRDKEIIMAVLKKIIDIIEEY